jgi:L-threonylcarbamoyladenylate synthase
VITTFLPVNPANPEPSIIARAAACLREGGLVAFPTETVYGLGVNALDAVAVRRLFAAKDRPASDPLIVHLADSASLERVAREIPDVALRLAERFWPGPLTIVLPRGDEVPSEVAAGGNTVAVRVPVHPVAQALLRAAAIPIAAPSANLFSRPSPTRAEHVRDDLNGRIDIILDGGPTTVGVESTVLDLTTIPPVIWRPGAVTLTMIRELVPDAVFANDRATDGITAPSPGLLSKHYAPRAPLTLYEGTRERVVARMSEDARTLEAAGKHVGMLTWDNQSAEAIASELYATFRRMDAAGVDVILAAGIDGTDGLAAALRDRLRRAAAGRIVRLS